MTEKKTSSRENPETFNDFDTLYHCTTNTWIALYFLVHHKYDAQPPLKFLTDNWYSNGNFGKDRKAEKQDQTGQEKPYG